MGNYWDRIYPDSSSSKPANPDSVTLSESLRAIGILPSASREEIDRVLIAIHAETGEPFEIFPAGDSRALVRDAQSDAHYLLANRQNPIPALRLAESGLCFVEVIGGAPLAGLPTDGPSILDDPNFHNDQVLRVAGVKMGSSGKHGQTSVEFNTPWREVVTRYLFKRPEGVKVGPPVQLAEGVSLVTSGILPLPTSRARMDGQPVRYAVPLWAEVKRAGAWNFHRQNFDPDEIETLLRELPEADASLASKSKKRAA